MSGLETMALLNFISEVEREATIPAVELVLEQKEKEAPGGLELAV